MPKLKELTVQGFKSFAEALTLTFPTGITAIVGPNGSGKSNVADAVRWVLGEQRMRSLRGRTGEDMIFAGSKKRARAGMARVALTFDNSDGWLPLDFAEVIIERRTYRDGKTDYLLNGSRVRLMDLRDVLDRAGLGRDAYLTVGQGLVDQVLSLRPTERTALFEQAAGIAPYRTRREEALRRLEDTQHNLERVRDIVGEIEPRLRRLEREVARVEQHAQLSAELKSLLRVWYGYRWGQALQRVENARQRAHYRAERVARQQEAVEGVLSRAAGLRAQMTSLRAQLAELHRENSARHAEAEALQRELAVTQERRRSLQEQHAEAQANLAPLYAAQEDATQELAQLEAAQQEAARQLEAAQATLRAVEVEYRQVEAQRHTLLSRQSAAQAQALEHRHRLTDRQSRLEQLAERAEQLRARVEQLEGTLNAAQERRRNQQAQVEEARRALEQLESVAADVQAEEERLQAALDAARAEAERLRRELAQKQLPYQQLTARLEALERLHAEGAGLYAGVRAVLQAVERGQLRGLPGTFAALVRVPSELDKAIETALGGQLQDVIAARWEDARAAIEWLKQQRAGRATFLPLDNLRPAAPLELPALQGVIGVASALVSYEDRALEPAVRLLLGRVAVVADLDAARALYQRLRGSYQIVTLQGEILRSGGSLTGGQERREREGDSLLARERERRELPEHVESLEAEIKVLTAALTRSEEQGRALSQDLRALSERQREAERQRQNANRILERAVRELEQVIQETDWQRRLLGEAGEERERLEATRLRLEQEHQQIAAQLAEAEAVAAQATAELEAVSDEEASRAVVEQRTQTALVQQRYENQRVLLATRQREWERLCGQIGAQEQRVVALNAELETLSQRVETLRAGYETARVAAEGTAGQIPALEQTLAGLEQQQEQLEEEEGRLRSALRDAEQRYAEVEIEARRREDQLATLRREIEEALEIVVADLPENLSAQHPLPLGDIAASLPAVAELPEGLEQQLRDLRTQINRLEPINTAAKAEYDEVAERHGFLREQAADLETASAHLRKIITELDELMQTAFDTTFQAIATEFSRVFALLFNGGTAQLVLESSPESDLPGVEIIARPPGKRTSGLGMLSGGERTLTAVALLFAVMHVSPTPFCILDEVDAMLDEANVGRFRAMLRELGRSTQFIIVTHNRGTVEVADTIYGVSMGEDGVSQVLSLSLQDLPTSEEI
ncbi:MAG TPA: chromosome segregation protein SMC [Anaerolineae bacterium]|nr:MAG: Chromosome partition protein Smc [Chloroflexi bacterium ADurb.Bin222]HOC21056.1 chromosome segregation protein SMC [Anaerolineae bacterium]HQM14092.1 chromosome segregation protein SMC [Anaerolineae bacterium]